jgi:hypothetical protein
MPQYFKREKMKITYKLTKTEYLEALQLHHKKGIRRILMAVYMAFAVAVIIIGTDFSNTREIIRNFLVLFFALSFYMLLTRIISTYQSKKIYEKSETLSNEVILRVSGKGIKVDNQSASIPWDVFSKYKENNDYYILYTSISNFKIIPKRVLSELERKEFTNYFDKYIHKM